MFNLSDYFSIDTTNPDKRFTLYKFDNTKENQFVKDCLDTFLDAYISSEDLNKIVEGTKKNKDPKKVRKEKIASRIPQKPNLKSGDFGEILSYILMEQSLYTDANVKPKKWRWKEGSDNPSHYTDLIFFKCDDSDNPQTTDYLVTSEVKCGASKPSKNSRIKDAIDGAKNDVVGRMGRTISYVINQYERDGDFEMSTKVERFKDPVTIPYNKKFNAIAIVENSFLKNHINNTSSDDFSVATTYNIAIYILPMNRLKTIYENIYNQLPNL